MRADCVLRMPGSREIWTRLFWLSRVRGARAMMCLLAVGLLPIHAATFQAGPWPVEVTLVADKPVILLGEPTSVSYIVRNLSRDNLEILVGGDYQNELGRPASFQ